MSLPSGAIYFILHCHFSTVPIENYDSPAVKEWIEMFIRNQLIEMSATPNVYSTTNKGQAWVEMICATPMPVVKYVDPRAV